MVDMVKWNEVTLELIKYVMWEWRPLSWVGAEWCCPIGCNAMIPTHDIDAAVMTNIHIARAGERAAGSRAAAAKSNTSFVARGGALAELTPIARPVGTTPSPPPFVAAIWIRRRSPAGRPIWRPDGRPRMAGGSSNYPNNRGGSSEMHITKIRFDVF